ncbi:MAG: Fe-S-cluster-containing hydrogenase subunit [Nitrospirae bacterium]|nr:MAG: Fe-S-cluster-containing hydrogenase subunit [Nitrospirota bacterium]
MSMNRREFIKLAGISTLVGVGGVSVFNKLQNNALEASEFTAGPEALNAKQWAMVIDMSKFKTPEDYKRCMDACHSTHNVPNFNNPKDEIKWIWPETFEHAFPGQEHKYMNEETKEKSFLLLCNHCANPACVRVCPTKATFKRKDGVVMQDMHRCIGCRFCMAACPFGARSFNYRSPRGKDENGQPLIKEENPAYPTRMLGVVEKCTFCTERLAIGKLPKCVEVSDEFSKGALVFGDLADPNSEVRKIITTKYTIRRKPELGTEPSVFYVIGGNDYAIVPELL